MNHIDQANELLNKPFIRYANSTYGFESATADSYGFESATADFQFLMDFTLGTDCGQELNDKLDQKRWAMQDHYKKLHGWDIC